MVGLTSQASTATSGSSHLDYAIYCSSGFLMVYEAGAPQGSFGSYTEDSVLGIQLTGEARRPVEFVRDGRVFYTSTTAVPGPMHLAVTWNARAGERAFATEIRLLARPDWVTRAVFLIGVG